MLRVSFSPVPECVVLGLLETGFPDPPRAPGRCYYYCCCCVEPPVFIYQKVIYNIGTEILMLQCNLHNSTQEAPTELSFSGICTKFRDENNGIGPSAVAAT